MVNRVDGVILGVGIVVLVASIIGVALYDEGGGQTFTISWSEGETQTLSEQSDSGGPNEYTFDVPVNGTNIATVSYMVEVAANGPQTQDDSVTVEVSGPNGTSADCGFSITAIGGSGSNACTADATVMDSPTGFSLTAQNRSAAEAAALEQVSHKNGSGTWTVTVTIDGGTELSSPSYQISVTPELVEWVPTANIPSTGSGPG